MYIYKISVSLSVYIYICEYMHLYVYDACSSQFWPPVARRHLWPLARHVSGIRDLGFRVQGWDLGSRVQGLGFRAFGIWGLQFRFQVR